MLLNRQENEFAYFTSILWNDGIYYQRLNHLQEAERFMSLAMQFLPFCTKSLNVKIKYEIDCRVMLMI